MSNKYQIGCSGYYYPSWKNKFYPIGMQAKNWLEYYSSVFNSVELNGTFYQTPKLSDLNKYAHVTPKDFTFSIKISKYITHILRLKDSKPHIRDFQNLIQEGLSDKLSCFLFQLPPTFHFNEENLERIITNIPHESTNIIEFRHFSWWNSDVKKAFSDARLTFCNIDFPGLPTEIINTSPQFYLRLHGNPELFKSSYSETALESFYGKIPSNAEHCNVYFNNTFYEGGYTNAIQFMKIIVDK